MRRPAKSTVAITLAALSLSVGACSSLKREGHVTMLASWVDGEEDAFKKELDLFEKENHIQVDYQGTRALNQVLLSQVQKGAPPDVAALWSTGELVRYAQNGDLHKLNDVIGPALRGDYRPQWRLAESSADGAPFYVIPMKANLKSMIWVNPHQVPRPWPATWTELMARTKAEAAAKRTPWCMGMSDPPTSGWAGTDWIEDILLHRYGPDVYQRWASGTLPWTSKEVTDAWRTWGEIATHPEYVHDGGRATLLTHYRDAGWSMIGDPPECSLQHQPAFVMSYYQGKPPAGKTSPRPISDYDYFPFPKFDGHPEESAVVSVDMLGMFNDTPEARKLVGFLASTEAQRIWPSIPRSAAFSLNKRINNTGSDPISRSISNMLTSPRYTLCLDASDQFPATIQTAFNRAALEYVNKPERLPAILGELEHIRTTVQLKGWSASTCGK